MRRSPLYEAITKEPGAAKLANALGLRDAANIEPLLRISDLERVLNCSRRMVERMRSSGRLPKPDLYVGNRSPRWHANTIREWIRRGGQP